jgi:hypothetical protein
MNWSTSTFSLSWYTCHCSVLTYTPLQLPKDHGSIQSRGDRIFSCTQRPPSLLFSGYKGPFSQGSSSTSVKLTIWDLHLVPRLRLTGTKLKLLHMPSWLSQGQLYLHLSNCIVQFIAQTYYNCNCCHIPQHEHHECTCHHTMAVSINYHTIHLVAYCLLCYLISGAHSILCQMTGLYRLNCKRLSRKLPQTI